MKIEISRMSGAGNLFSVIDNRYYNLDENALSKLAQISCSINEFNDFKAEGLLVLEVSDKSHNFKSSFYNPDGSSGMLCGNGGRCIVHYAISKNLVAKFDGQYINFSMAGKEYKAIIKKNTIKLFLPPPTEIKAGITILLDNKNINADYYFVGTDHLIIDIKELSIENIYDLNIEDLGPKVRYHEKFQPKGTNANFYTINPNQEVLLRTYERGVEAETGACGTGSVATALSASKAYGLSFPITIIPPSKMPLIVDIEGDVEIITSVSLEGHAEVLKTDIIDIPDNIFINESII